MHHATHHPPNTPTLALKNVSVRYGNIHALDDITLTLDPGDQVAVVGPNGAGKSTLFDLITGIIKPTSGRVDVHGSEPGGHICIGYVPQRNQIDWRFPVNVFDVVMMGRASQIGLMRWPKRVDRLAVCEALERVGMAEFAKRQISELSGGQQQRVFLARALAQETHLLLLDEPLTGLDIPSQDQLLTILRDLQNTGITMLVATHDLNQAAQRFAHVLLLNHRTVAYGSPQEVLTSENLAAAYGMLMRAGESQSPIPTPASPAPTPSV